jgi:hypothetical protein
MLPNMELVVRLVAGVINVIGSSGRSIGRKQAGDRHARRRRSTHLAARSPRRGTAPWRRPAASERKDATAECQPTDAPGLGSHCCGSRPRRTPTPTLTSSLVRLSPTRGIGRSLLHHEGPVAADHLGDLELRCGRQHQVGVPSCIGHRQIVHHGEQVVAAQPATRWPARDTLPQGSSPARRAPRHVHPRRRSGCDRGGSY